MDCKRAMELITLFVNGQLNTEDTEAFLNHIDSCPECREELEVTYSLMMAMKQIDEDTDLSDNYIGELNKKIEACYLDELKRKRSCARRRFILAVVVLLLVFMNGITVKEKRKEEDRRFFRRITGEEEPEKKGAVTGFAQPPGDRENAMGVAEPPEGTDAESGLKDEE